MNHKILPILFFLSLLGGCIHEYLPPAPPKQGPAETKLAEAAVSVSDSLQTLEGIRKAENPYYIKLLPNPNLFGMKELATVDWVGPIGPLVAKLAIASEYHLQVLGHPPAIPIIIQIHKKNIPLALILRDADYQAGTKADIVVYTSKRIIELRYRDAYTDQVAVQTQVDEYQYPQSYVK